MSKWLNKFLDSGPRNSTDNTDRFKSETNMSVLSVPPGGPFDKNLRNLPETRTDKTDRFDLKPNMSVLSVPPEGPFGKNLGNIPEARTDNTDRFDLKPNMSVLSVPSQRLLDQDYVYSYEERIAIAEVDGNQNPTDAHCIACLDAFISILSALAEDDPHQDWLAQKIQTALATLEVQNFRPLN